MSERNPNVVEVLSNSTGNEKMRAHLSKDYLNCAKNKFFKTFHRKANITDCQTLYDFYESDWKDSLIDKPLRIAANKKKGESVWNYGKKYQIDVYGAMCRFIEYLYSPTSFNVYGKPYLSRSCADLMKEKNIEFMETHIIDGGLLVQWKEWLDKNHKTLPKYHKPRYIDFSQWAYNGVTDDF